MPQAKFGPVRGHCNALYHATIQRSLDLCEQSLSLSLAFLAQHDYWGQSTLTLAQFIYFLDRTAHSKTRLQALQARLDALT